MADANTSNYSFVKPEVGASEDTWGGKLNQNWDDLDTLLGGVTQAQFAYLDVTALGTSEASKVVTADANGDVAVAEEFKAKSYNETHVSLTSSANAVSLNCEAGNVFSHTLSENTTFTFANPPASGTAYSMTVKIVQDGSGSGYSITWPASVDWSRGSTPFLSVAANAVDIFVFYTTDGGTTWYGFLAGRDLS